MAWSAAPLVNAGWRGGQNGGTSSASLDTTGCDFFVMHMGSLALNGTPTDSKGNTWSTLTLQSQSAGSQLFYSVPTSVGTGHTFNIAATNGYPSCQVQGWSGADQSSPFSSENGNQTASTPSTSISTGSVTPNASGDLVVTGAAGYLLLTTMSIDNGFTISDDIPYDAVSSYDGAMAWKLQTGAVNPQWSWTGARNAAANIATFKAAAATTTTYHFLSLLGAGS